jgi:hypothetical protein
MHPIVAYRNKKKHEIQIWIETGGNPAETWIRYVPNISLELWRYTMHKHAYGKLICDCVTRLSAQLSAGHLTWALKLTPSPNSAGCRVSHLSSQVDPVSHLSCGYRAPHLSSQVDPVSHLSCGYRVPHLSSQVDPVSQRSWMQGPSTELSSWPRLSSQRSWVQGPSSELSSWPRLSSQRSWVQGPSPELSSWPRLSAQLDAGSLIWALKLTPSLISAGCRAPHLSSQVDPVSHLNWVQGPSPGLSSWPRYTAQLRAGPRSVQVDPDEANEKIPFSVSECCGWEGGPAAGGWGSRSRPMRSQGTPLLNALHQSPVDRVQQSVQCVNSAVWCFVGDDEGSFQHHGIHIYRWHSSYSLTQIEIFYLHFHGLHCSIQYIIPEV